MFMSERATRPPVFDAPLDTWYLWLGLCAVSVAIAGVALALPTTAPPDAAGVADTIDGVASGRSETRTTVSLAAETIRLGPRRIALRTGDATAHAQFAFGPVTPARTACLTTVLEGTPPGAVFRTATAFQSALDRDRSRRPTWRPAPETLVARHVSWRGVNATLVG